MFSNFSIDKSQTLCNYQVPNEIPSNLHTKGGLLTMCKKRRSQNEEQETVMTHFPYHHTVYNFQFMWGYFCHQYCLIRYFFTFSVKNTISHCETFVNVVICVTVYSNSVAITEKYVVRFRQWWTENFHR